MITFYLIWFLLMYPAFRLFHWGAVKYTETMWFWFENGCEDVSEEQLDNIKNGAELAGIMWPVAAVSYVVLVSYEGWKQYRMMQMIKELSAAKE